MKRLVILLILFSCGRQQTDNSEHSDTKDKTSTDLYSLLEKLPTLKKPLTFSSEVEVIANSLPGRNNELIKKIQAIDPAFNPYGKVYQTNDFIAVIAIGSADRLIPVLVTFNKNGHIIDSFSMYPNAGGDIEDGYYSKNIATLTENKELILIDSTRTRKTKKKGTDQFIGPDSLSITSEQFQINDNGKIEKIK